MNPNQKLWVRISHNQNASELIEVDALPFALKRIAESYINQKMPSNRKVQMVIELSNQPMPLGNTLLSREQQLEQNMMSQAMNNPDEIVYEPDVTLRECNEAWESPEGQLMFQYQRAENRIGIDPAVLMQIHESYHTKFPRVAPHGPLWTKS